ncbi:MAG: discoidin domain-containing protein [Sphingobacteriales bacterium]|nr:MAG: discoidin domain-containing protein [Sphingobacteriales bacterium]
MTTKIKIPALLLLSFIAVAACKKTEHPGKIPITDEPIVKPAELTIYDSVINNQVAYILAAQMPSGALKDTEASNSRICGYFANIACRALLKSPTAENIAAVKKYMAWYMSKLNGNTNPVTGGVEIPGSIYDYYAPGETTNGTYDSVDSYAATFLALAKELAEISATEKAWVTGYATQLTLIGSALEKCIDTEDNDVPTTFGTDDNDGLSVDSYVHGAKYAMDNAEVNEGLKAMVWLQTNVLGGSKTAHFQALLTANTDAIETQLWRGTMYNWNDNGSTGATISKWSTFYADATCQLYPGMYGVIEPLSKRANQLYTAFNVYYPAWSGGTVYSGAYPWAVVSYAAAVLNDKVRVDEYIKHILTFNKTGKQKDYWYNAEAAFVILAADRMKNQGNTPIYSPEPLIDEPEPADNANLALNQTATASTSFNDPQLSIDGDASTRWSLAAATENEWYKVDLGKTRNISRVDIKWEGAYATEYSIQVSSDDATYTTAFSTTTSTGGDVSHTFTAVNARYVKILLTKGALPYPMSFWEFEVYKK